MTVIKAEGKKSIFAINGFGIGHNDFKDLRGHTGDIQKQLETWLWTYISSIFWAEDEFGTHSVRDK